MRRQGYDWARVVATVSQDRAGRLAVATVRLGLAVLSSGITLLPWPTRARLDALFVAAGGCLTPIGVTQ